MGVGFWSLAREMRMSDTDCSPKQGSPGRWLRDAAFYAWFYVHLYVMVQPHLVYQARGPVFSRHPEFLASVLPAAGGVCLYVSLFLAQLLANDALGALVLVGLGVLIGVLSHACFAALARQPVPAVRFVPLLFYVVACSRYEQ
ncbi:MAG: DUF6057 family protein, partial [Armatimonadota bacterium]|nr:DUF6057 family protein [Armatimonadota bacterium]